MKIHHKKSQKLFDKFRPPSTAVDNIIHNIHLAIPHFSHLINIIPTIYPPLIVDNRTVVLTFDSC